MNRDEERTWITDAVREAYDRSGVTWPPVVGGPTPLQRLIRDFDLPTSHVEIEGLNHGAVASDLGRFGVRWADVPNPDPRLDGFLYATADTARIFVRKGDYLPRRRFSAAHELGHLVLHLGPKLAAEEPGAALFHGDQAIADGDESDEDAMERQANRFAAEILMPEEACRFLHERVSRKYGESGRLLQHRLASDLLVSRSAAAWRLYGLGIGPRPGHHEPMDDPIEDF